MLRIYIAYRSTDSHQKAVTQLYSQLADTFDAENVTLSQQNDRLSITDLQAQVRRHDVLLVVFGRYGLDMVDESGNRSLADPYDPIHVEIDTALKARLTVKTLLFDDSVDVFSERLPKVLRSLARKDVIQVTSKAELPAITETLIADLAHVRPKETSVTQLKPDLLKPVAQPPRHPRSSSTPSEPIIHHQPTHNPFTRLMRILRIFAMTRSPRFVLRRLPPSPERTDYVQPEHQAHRPRMESYRQIWPINFL